MSRDPPFLGAVFLLPGIFHAYRYVDLFLYEGDPVLPQPHRAFRTQDVDFFNVARQREKGVITKGFHVFRNRDKGQAVAVGKRVVADGRQSPSLDVNTINL